MRFNEQMSENRTKDREKTQSQKEKAQKSKPKNNDYFGSTPKILTGRGEL